MKYFSKGPIEQLGDTASGNGFAPHRQQAMVWSNDVPDCWRLYASPGLKAKSGIYSRVPLYRILICHDTTPDPAIEDAESESDIGITTGTLYLALTV